MLMEYQSFADSMIIGALVPEKGMTWTPRLGNRLAHAVAKAAEAETLRSSWSTRSPGNKAAESEFNPDHL